MDRDDHEQLEAILLKYIERFGLIPEAEEYFRKRVRDEPKAKPSGISKDETRASLDRFGDLPE